MIIVFYRKEQSLDFKRVSAPDSRNGRAAWWHTSKLFSFLAKFATSSSRITPDWRPRLLKKRNTSCLETEQMRLHSVGKCRHENFRSIIKLKLKSCNQLHNVAVAIWKNVAMDRFVQRLNLNGCFSRQNGACMSGMWYTTTRAIPVKWQTVNRTERGQTIV